MNYLKGKNCASYCIKEIENYLVDNPNTFEEKRYIEALIGLILAKSLSEYLNENVNIGWIFNNSEKDFNIPKVEEILDSKIEIIDDDFDFFLESEKLFCLIQATRFCFADTTRDKMEQFKALLNKKNRISVNKKLHLAVLLDEDFDLSFDELTNFIIQENVPYEEIYVISQMGNNKKLGKFQVFKIYPTLLRLDNVNVGFN